jgi:hypothetical protein
MGGLNYLLNIIDVILSSEGEDVVKLTLPVYASHFVISTLSNICVEINRVSNFDLETVLLF